MINAKQVKAARVLLDWTQADLARHADLSVEAIKSVELGKTAPRRTTIEKITTACERAGVEFTDRSGTRLTGNIIRVFEGDEEFGDFLDDIYVTISITGGDILVCGTGGGTKFVEQIDKSRPQHTLRMEKLDNFSFKAISGDKDSSVAIKSYVQLRYLPNETLPAVPFYIYGDRLAIILWKTIPKVILINDPDVSNSYKEQFNILWKMGKIANATSSDINRSD